ncbi:MAG: hypothetical protein HY234_15660 [Acidobacteria bacterium]|nr:hypothetical protein [Acidobacteriota bacterium]MBI3664471.1 hypothetical protein [Acidobacteriota bacterium]
MTYKTYKMIYITIETSAVSSETRCNYCRAVLQRKDNIQNLDAHDAAEFLTQLLTHPCFQPISPPAPEARASDRCAPGGSNRPASGGKAGTQ